MPKKLVKQITEEIIKEPAEIAKEVVKQAGIAPETEKQPEEEKISQEEIAKRRVKAKRILAAHQVELRDIQQLPKQITGKPGFSEEKLAQQVEEGKKKKKEPPPLVAAKRPIGTRERLKRILG